MYVWYLVSYTFATFAPSCDTTKHVSRQQQAKSECWVWVQELPVNNSVVLQAYTLQQPSLPRPTVPSSRRGQSEGQLWAECCGQAGYFGLCLAPLTHSIDGTAVAQRRGLWVMPPLACGCLKPFPCSPTLQPDRLSTPRPLQRPTTEPDSTTWSSKQYSVQSRTHADTGQDSNVCGSAQKLCMKQNFVLMFKMTRIWSYIIGPLNRFNCSKFIKKNNGR